MTEDAGCDVAPQKWGHVPNVYGAANSTNEEGHDSPEALVERVRAEAQRALAELEAERSLLLAEVARWKEEARELAERLKAAEAKWYAAAPFRANWLQALEARDRAVAQRDEALAAAEQVPQLVKALTKMMRALDPESGLPAEVRMVRAGEVAVAALAKVRG